MVDTTVGEHDAWWARRPGRELLALLLATDLVFIAGSLAFSAGLLSDDRVRLDVDRGMPETWGYVQLLWAGLALLLLAWRHREALYVALGAAVGFLLLDDAGQLHETGGRWLRDEGLMSPVLGLEADDAGELVVVAVAAVVLAVLVGLAYRRASAQARVVGRGVIGCIVAIAAAGVGLDVVHAVVGVAETFFVVLEDGGELVAGSVLAAFLVATTLLSDGPTGPWRRGRTVAGDPTAAPERLPAPTGLPRRG